MDVPMQRNVSSLINMFEEMSRQVPAKKPVDTCPKTNIRGSIECSSGNIHLNTNEHSGSRSCSKPIIISDQTIVVENINNLEGEKDQSINDIDYDQLVKKEERGTAVNKTNEDNSLVDLYDYELSERLHQIYKSIIKLMNEFDDCKLKEKVKGYKESKNMVVKTNEDSVNNKEGTLTGEIQKEKNVVSVGSIKESDKRESINTIGGVEKTNKKVVNNKDSDIRSNEEVALMSEVSKEKKDVNKSIIKESDKKESINIIGGVENPNKKVVNNKYSGIKVDKEVALMSEVSKEIKVVNMSITKESDKKESINSYGGVEKPNKKVALMDEVSKEKKDANKSIIKKSDKRESIHSLGGVEKPNKKVVNNKYSGIKVDKEGTSTEDILKENKGVDGGIIKESDKRESINTIRGVEKIKPKEPINNKDLGIKSNKGGKPTREIQKERKVVNKSITRKSDKRESINIIGSVEKTNKEVLNNKEEVLISEVLKENKVVNKSIVEESDKRESINIIGGVEKIKPKESINNKDLGIKSNKDGKPTEEIQKEKKGLNVGTIEESNNREQESINIKEVVENKNPKESINKEGNNISFKKIGNTKKLTNIYEALIKEEKKNKSSVMPKRTEIVTREVDNSEESILRRKQKKKEQEDNKKLVISNMSQMFDSTEIRNSNIIKPSQIEKREFMV